MNKQELIERLKDFKVPFGDESEYVKIDTVIKLASDGCLIVRGLRSRC